MELINFTILNNVIDGYWGFPSPYSLSDGAVYFLGAYLYQNTNQNLVKTNHLLINGLYCEAEQFKKIRYGITKFN